MGRTTAKRFWDEWKNGPTGLNAEMRTLREIYKTAPRNREGSLPEWLRPFLPALQDAALTPLQQIARELEALPIQWAASATTPASCVGFYLSDGEWFPLYAMDEPNADGLCVCGYHNAADPEDGEEYKYGIRETLCAMPGQWAHCTADNLPSMPWAWEEENDVMCVEAENAVAKLARRLLT